VVRRRSLRASRELVELLDDALRDAEDLKALAPESAPVGERVNPFAGQPGGDGRRELGEIR
jgi:hypothetical protein